jgi:hypothetical protein
MIGGLKGDGVHELPGRFLGGARIMQVMHPNLVPSP